MRPAIARAPIGGRRSAAIVDGRRVSPVHTTSVFTSGSCGKGLTPGCGMPRSIAYDSSSAAKPKRMARGSRRMRSSACTALRMPPSAASALSAPSRTMPASSRSARYRFDLPLPLAPVTTVSRSKGTTRWASDR